MPRALPAALIGAAIFMSGSVQAAPSCWPRDAVLSQLAERFDEHPIGVGLSNNGALMELLTSPDGRTWMVILTMPNGRSCFAAAGEGWQVLEIEPEGEAS